MPIDKLSLYFVQEHPRETAKILGSYSANEAQEFLESISHENAAVIIRYMPPEQALECLNIAEANQAAEILQCLEIEISARLLGRLKNDTRSGILNKMTPTISHRLRQLLRYPVGTLGRLISPDIFIANQDMNVQAVIESARSSKSELLSDIFVIDDSYALCGLVTLRELLLADPELKISQIMGKPDTVLNVRANPDYVKDNPIWQTREVLPVTDHKNLFVGVIKRSSLFEMLSSKYYHEKKDVPLMETVVEVADLFWEICSDMIFPKGDDKARGQNNDRK